MPRPTLEALRDDKPERLPLSLGVQVPGWSDDEDDESVTVLRVDERECGLAVPVALPSEGAGEWAATECGVNGPESAGEARWGTLRGLRASADPGTAGATAGAGEATTTGLAGADMAGRGVCRSESRSR